jgi:DNA-binding beta-propeller fold protein YncE
LADCRNHRIQKFSPDGDFLGSFGSFGSGPGQFDMPWGVALDQHGLVYVADWRNDRIQQFTSDGEFQAAFGSSGSGPGQFNRPTGVCVDRDGDIYVADWLNNRVQVLAPDGRFITALLGDAGLSKWAQEKLAANPDMIRQRSLVQDLTPERRFQNPSAVKVDGQGRIVVVEPPRHRIQVYQKLSSPVLPPR